MQHHVATGTAMGTLAMSEYGGPFYWLGYNIW